MAFHLSMYYGNFDVYVYVCGPKFVELLCLMNNFVFLLLSDIMVSFWKADFHMSFDNTLARK